MAPGVKPLTSHVEGSISENLVMGEEIVGRGKDAHAVDKPLVEVKRVANVQRREFKVVAWL